MERLIYYWEIAVMAIEIIFALTVAVLVIVAAIVGRKELTDKVYFPWEKAEERAAKKKAKEEARARREFWRS